MNTIAPRLRLIVFVALVAVLCGGAALLERTAPVAQPADAALVMPDRVLAHLSISGKACVKGSKTLAIARILEEPEVATFLKPFDGLFAMGKEKAGGKLEQLGLDVSDLLALTSGRLSVTFSGMYSRTVQGPNGDEQVPQPEIWASFDFSHAKESGLRVIRAVTKMLASEPGAADAMKRVEIGGTTITVSTSTGPGTPEFAWMVRDSQLVVCSNPSALKKALTNPSAGARSDSFELISARVKRDDAIVFAYADVRGLLDEFVGMLPEEAAGIIDSLGFGAIQGAGYSFGIEGRGFRDRFFLHAPKREGLFAKVSKPGPVTLDRLVPEDTAMFGAGSLEIAPLYDWGLDVLSKLAPPAHEAVTSTIAEMEHGLGVQLRRDVLANLGPEYGLYAAFEGQALIPDAGIVIQVQDAPKIDAIIKKILGQLAPELPIKSTTCAGGTINYAHLGGMGLDFFSMPPLKPSWTFIGDKMVITPWPQAAKNLLAGLRAQEPRLADNADYKSLLAELRESNPAAGNGGIEYFDVKRLAGFLLDNGVPFIQSAIPEGVGMDVPLEIDWAAFPRTKTITQHLFGLMAASTWTKDGLHAEYVSPMGVFPTYVAMVGAIAIPFVAGVSGSAKEEEAIVIEMPPDLTETRPRAAPRLNTGKHRKAQLDITSLRACVKMFQMREHRLPTESDWPGFLTQGSQNHPDPYLDPQRHPGGKILDPWGNSYVYRRTSSRDFEIRSLGADGKKGGTGANADISSKKQQRRK